MGKEALLKAGCDKAEICPTEGNPVVYGEKHVGDNLPTVLVYGHYDVQPAVPLELWDTDPFEPVIKKTEPIPMVLSLLVVPVMTKDRCSCT